MSYRNLEVENNVDYYKAALDLLDIAFYKDIPIPTAKGKVYPHEGFSVQQIRNYSTVFHISVSFGKSRNNTYWFLFDKESNGRIAYLSTAASITGAPVYYEHVGELIDTWDKKFYGRDKGEHFRLCQHPDNPLRYLLIVENGYFNKRIELEFNQKPTRETAENAYLAQHKFTAEQIRQDPTAKYSQGVGYFDTPENLRQQYYEEDKKHRYANNPKDPHFENFTQYGRHIKR